MPKHSAGFKGLFAKPDYRRKQAVHTVYMETLALLNERLPRAGFQLTQENHAGLGGLAVFNRGGLTVRLFMDLRDDICVFTAESGTVRKWLDAEGHEMSSRYDLYIYLSEPEIRLRFPPELERWLEEHPA